LNIDFRDDVEAGHDASFAQSQNLTKGQIQKMTEVISKTTDGPEKSIRRYTLLAVFLTIFLDLVGFGMFIPIMPSIARELNASNSQAAYLSALFSLGTLLAVMVLGRISDSVGRRKILIFTITLSIAAQAATGFATQIGSYAVLAFIRFIAGVAAGNISVAQAAIADITPIHERSRSMVVIGLAFGAGFAFGPALGAAITLFFPENPLFPIAMAAVIINAVNLLLVIFKFRETHHRFAPQELASVVAAARVGSEEAGAQLSTKAETLKLLKRPYFKTILLMQFIQVFGFVGVETILPLALADAFTMNQSSIYKAFLFLGCAVLLLNGGLSRPLLKKLGETRTLNIGQLFLTLGVFLIPWVAPDRSSLYAALACLSLGSALSNPALSGLVSRLSPNDRQGMALGMAQSLSAGARILGPAFMGLLYEFLNGAASLYISSALLLVVTVIGMAGLRGLPRMNTRLQSQATGESP
jgi:MFS family permease